MQTEPRIDALLSELLNEWNRAENLGKQAEVLRSELAMPFIAELRYAGRRTMDAIAALQRDDQEGAARQLLDAINRCKAARYDALDVIVLYLVATLEKAYGRSLAISTSSKEVDEGIRELYQARNLIAHTRGDRESRSETYEEIEQRLPDLIHQILTAQGEAAKSDWERRKESLKKRRMVTMTGIFAVVALAGITAVALGAGQDASAWFTALGAIVAVLIATIQLPRGRR